MGAAEAWLRISNNEAIPGRDDLIKSDEVVFCTTGDGTTSEGEFWESLNTACNLALPVVYLVEDNGYAISVPVEVNTAGGSISKLVASFPGLFIQEVDGCDPLASYDVLSRAIDYARQRKGPALVHAKVIRPYSHSLSDDEVHYRPTSEREQDAARDPVFAFPKYLVAQGIATERDLRDYFRMGVAETKIRIAELAEAGELIPVAVKGWDQPAWLDPAARRPRKVSACALLSPFDNLIWFRERTERLFGVRVRLEIYTPAHKRTHGYYVLPLLQGEAITARVDLKAERKAGVLAVQAAHAEPGANGATAELLAGELRLMAGWLGLDRVEVRPKGDLAAPLAEALR